MDNQAIVIALVAGLVLVAYLVDWIVRRERGQRLPLGQDPLRVLRVAVGRVWRQRGLLLALMGFFVAAQLVTQFVSDPLINEPEKARLERAGMKGGDGEFKAVGQGIEERWQQVTSGKGWTEALYSSVPYLGQTPRQFLDTLVTLALLLALAIGYWRLWRAQPDWLGEGERRLLVGFAIASAAMSAVVLLGRLWWMRHEGAVSAPSPLAVLMIIGTLLALVPVVPLTGAVWHGLLQAVRTGACSFSLAVRTALVVWRSVLGYMLLLTATVFLTPLLGNMLMGLGFGSRMVFGMAVWLPMLGMFLPTILLFVPLVLVDQRVGLWKAMGTHFDMVGDNAWDVFLFAVRLMALMLPVRLLLAVIQFGPTAGWFEGVRGVLGEAVGLMMAVWVVGWFGVLRYGEERWLEGQG